MRTMMRGILSLASLAALTLAGTADAAAILSFGSTSGTKTATASGGTTTLSTTSGVTPGSYIVSITTLGNVTLNPLTFKTARETFTTVQSTGPAVLSGGVISQPFSGTISYLDNSTPSINYLTIVFNGVLRGSQGGLTADLAGDNTVPGQSVTFTSTDATVIPFLNDPVRQFTIGLTGLTSPLAITGGTIANFATSNESGNASTSAVPEPASVVMASTAVLAGLGCFGWRRSRSESL